MIFGKIDAEWAIRQILSDEKFLFEFFERSTAKNISKKNKPMIEFINHLMDINSAHGLLKLGFQQYGLPFVNYKLFDCFIQAHLHRVSIT